MNVERIDHPAVPATFTQQIADHLRIDEFDMPHALTLADAAVLELERHAQLALINTTIRVTLDGWPRYGRLRLPIAPLMTTEGLTVEARGEPVTGLEIRTGLRPSLGLSADQAEDLAEVEVIVTYTAGFGQDASSVPADLRAAVMDQAAAMFDARGAVDAKSATLSPHLARIAARYRGVAV